MHSTPHDPSAPTSVGRRTVIRGAAWSVPAISLASAAPAFATSGQGTYRISETTRSVADRTLLRCGAYPSPAVAFTVTSSRAISSTAADDRLMVTLPAGLVWLDGTPAAAPRPVAAPNTPVGAGGVATTVVTIPGIRAVAATGAYVITATFRGQTAQQTVWVTVTEGTYRQITRAQGGPDTAAAFSLAGVNVAQTKASAISGDQTAGSAGANAAVVLTNGTARIWGARTGDTATEPTTLAYAGTTLGSLAFVDSWTSTAWGANDTVARPAGADSAGGAVAQASTSGAAGVWAWFRDPSATGTTAEQTTRRPLRVARVTGLPTGAAVRALWSHAGMSYVLLQGQGVYQWSSFLPNPGTNTTVAATRMTSTAGATLANTWGKHRPPATGGGSVATHGGAALVGRTLRVWSQSVATAGTTGTVAALAPATDTTEVALPTEVGVVTRIEATDSGILLLDDQRRLWTYNTQDGANSWRQRLEGVADFSVWGHVTNLRYIGGTAIDTAGRVTQFFIDNAWKTAPVVGAGNAPLTGITRVESSDGTYLALRWDGTLYGWNGNIDNSGRTSASVLSGVTEALQGATSVDIGVWGFHHTTGARRYNGGGYIFTSVNCSV